MTKNFLTKQGSTLFLRASIVLIGLAALSVCVFALPIAIMSNDSDGYLPVLIGLYVPAVPFFFALYQALKLLHYIDKNTAFSDLSVVALKNIKYCAGAVGLFFTATMPYIFYVADYDDAPGVIVFALLIAFASYVIAVFVAVLEKLLRSAIAIKAENDLTV